MDNLFKHLDAIKCTPVEVVNKNFLPLIKGGGYNIMSGRGGLGKSIIALRSLIHFLLENETQKGLAVFSEDDRDEINKRLYTVCRNEFNLEDAQIGGIKKRIMFSTVDTPLPFKLATKQQGNVLISGEYYSLLKYIIRENIGFVILDPLKSLHTLDENSAPEMDVLMRDVLQQMGSQTSTVVLVLHHSSKSASGARGSGTIEDSARIGYRLDGIMQKHDDGKFTPHPDFIGKVRVTIGKDNKNIFREFCNILDNDGIMSVFPHSRTGVPVVYRSIKQATPVEEYIYEDESTPVRDSVTVSIANHNDAKNPKGFEKRTVAWDELIDVMSMGRAYSPAGFKDGHRKNDNYLGDTDLLFLDIDDGMTVDQAKEVFKNYKAIITTTRSHQKEKNGVVCDRFRVALMLDEAINIPPEEYKIAMQAVFDFFGSCDQSTKDPARFFFSSPDTCEVWYSEGQTRFSWRELYEKAKRIRAIEQHQRASASIDRVTTSGDIESALLKIDPDISFDEWLRIGMAIHSELGDGGFSLWDSWSARGSKYGGEKDLLSHWKTFGKGSGISVGTLFHMAGSGAYSKHEKISMAVL